MGNWQFCAQLLDRDRDEIAGLESAREAEYPRPELIAQHVGVRVRFNVETYEFSEGRCMRSVQFEVGTTSSAKCSDVALRIEGTDEVPVGDLEPGETRLVSAKLPFESMVQAMQGRVEAASDGKPVETVVTVSEPSRLLRDLFAPFFISHWERPGYKYPLAGFE